MSTTARVLGGLFATVLILMTSSCGDAPFIFGPAFTVQEVDVREANVIPIPGGGTLTIPANSVTAPTNPGLIVSNLVTIVLSIVQPRTPQDILDEDDKLVKRSFTGLLSFGPAGLKFNPPATVCFVFIPEEGLDPEDSRIFWTNQGTNFFAPVPANAGFPMLNDEGEEDEEPDDWIFCGDVGHFSRAYVGDVGLDPNGEELVIGDPETFFTVTSGSYDYDANNINLTSDTTFVHGGPYEITVETDGTVTLPATMGDLEFIFDSETDVFDASVFETNVIMVREPWQLTANQPLIPPGPVSFTLEDIDAANTGIVWRFDATGPTGMEGPLYNLLLGFVVEGSTYDEYITTVTDNDTGASPVYASCDNNVSVAVSDNGTAELDVFGGGLPASVKGVSDFYPFDWDFDSVTGTQVPPAMMVDTDVIRSVTWCEPDCGATPRDELTLEFLNEVFSVGTFRQLTVNGSIDYEFDTADGPGCENP